MNIAGLLPTTQYVEDVVHETLVTDHRTQVSPSEMVSNRLRQVLGHLPLYHSTASDLEFGRRPLAQEGASNRPEVEEEAEEIADDPTRP